MQRAGDFKKEAKSESPGTLAAFEFFLSALTPASQRGKG